MTGAVGGGLLWKLNRLRTMSAAEIAWRTARAMRQWTEARGWGLETPTEPYALEDMRPWLIAVPSGVDRSAVLRAADATLSGHFDVFALESRQLGFPPEWNRDPLTGTLAPLAFGKRLNYRDERRVGNIKYLWEPSRHLELVTLAQAFALTGDERYAAGARLLVSSWIEQCPYPLGVHWTSSLEHAVRLLNWSAAWSLLQAHGGLDPGSEFAGRWLACIELHQAFVAGHFSYHSSANNHLLGEAMGLFVGALTWPLWHRSAQWADQARTILEAEALKQNTPDGVNREQAFWYHHEVADMMLLCWLVGQRCGRPFGSQFQSRLLEMLQFVAAVMDVSGRVPMVGDSDDAVMLRLDHRAGFDPYRSLLASGAVVFGRSDFAQKAGTFDDKSRWLLGDDATQRFEELLRHPFRPTSPRGFDEGGYWLLGRRLDESDETRLLVDAGPLGYLAIAAHGHADALAFTLSAHGHELLVDPGTFAYHTNPAWRDYFRGTSAHNTVRIDGCDQSVPGGPFMWLRHAQSRCESFESTRDHDRWVGRHDGYERLAQPVTHRRTIHFDKAAMRIVVTDELSGPADEHLVELHWHFAENCEVRPEGSDAVVAQSGPVFLALRTTESALVREIFRGSESPPLGWISRRFDVRQPTTTVRWRGRLSIPVSVRSVIEIADRVPPTDARP